MDPRRLTRSPALQDELTERELRVLPDPLPNLCEGYPMNVKISGLPSQML
jgi:hypothetical protein